jgi:methionine-rich copper-binding protein CopC
MVVKKLMSIVFVLLLASSSSVSAHTGLKSSSPADGETVTGSMQEIHLEFETAIEKGSTLSLLDESGAKVSIKNVELAENKMKAAIKEPVENGLYIVNWRIVGEDGHLIEGNYSFNVQQENESNEGLDAVDEQTEESNQAADTEESAEESNPAPATDEAEEKSDSKSNIVIPLVTGFMLFVALQTGKWLIRRGKK